MMIEGEEEIAADVASAVTPAIENAVADAVERQEHREEIASVIADAAMETERMREVAALSERVEECQTVLEQLPVMLAEQTVLQLEAALAPILSRLSAVEGAPASLIVVPNPSELSPPILEGQPPIVIVEPDEQAPAAIEEEPAPPAPRKKRFRSI